jgi:hypothetical protein
MPDDERTRFVETIIPEPVQKLKLDVFLEQVQEDILTAVAESDGSVPFSERDAVIERVKAAVAGAWPGVTYVPSSIAVSYKLNV